VKSKKKEKKKEIFQLIALNHIISIPPNGVFLLGGIDI